MGFVGTFEQGLVGRRKSNLIWLSNVIIVLSHFSQCHPISRSISYTGRCALSSILSAAPEGIGGPGKRPTSGLSKTKTWCGPLDETMINLVGNKYVQACPGGRNEE